MSIWFFHNFKSLPCKVGFIFLTILYVGEVDIMTPVNIVNKNNTQYYIERFCYCEYYYSRSSLIWKRILGTASQARTCDVYRVVTLSYTHLEQ